VRLLLTMLRNRDLARIESAWATSSLGNWAFSILLALYAYRQGGTAAVALALIVRMLPSGLAAPYAAMLADRHPRQSVLLWSAVLRAASLLGAAAAAAAGSPFGLVLAFSALFTIANTAHRPAQAALLPQLARTPAELAAADVCWNALDYAGFLLGSLLAGLLVGLVGLDLGFAVCAGAFGLVALILRGLPVDPRPVPLEAPSGGVAELAAGLSIVRSQPEIRPLIGLFTVNAVSQGIFDVLVVVAAIELLGLGESGAGWLNAAWGVGGVLGGVAAMALLGRGRIALGLAAGFAVAGAAFAAIGAWPKAAPALLLMLIVGIGLALVEIGLLTLTQRLAADDVLGRVFGVQETIEATSIALGSVVAATLVALLGVGGAMIAAGAVLPVVAALSFRRVASSRAGLPVPERAFGLIRGLPLFAPLPVAVLESLALRLDERRYGAGEEIVVQGEAGDEFFVVSEGEVEVSVDGAVRSVQRPGGFFGEIALLWDVPRTATVTAVGPVVAMVIERDQFIAGVASHARCTGAAKAVAHDRLEDNARAAAIGAQS